MNDPTPLPAVFVHGLIGTLDDRAVLDHFVSRPVLAPDLLGYGRHAGVSPEAIDLQAQVAHLKQVIDSAGMERVHLVGHSVGGVVAALFADRHAQQAASLVSVEGNFSLADAFWSAKLAGMTAEEVELLLARHRDDPANWLRRAGLTPDERLLGLARRWLAHQPPSTVHGWPARSSTPPASAPTRTRSAAFSPARPCSSSPASAHATDGTCRSGRSPPRPPSRPSRGPGTS
jgi:lipase